MVSLYKDPFGENIFATTGAATCTVASTTGAKLGRNTTVNDNLTRELELKAKIEELETQLKRAKVKT